MNPVEVNHWALRRDFQTSFRTHLKNRILVQDRGGAELSPAERDFPLDPIIFVGRNRRHTVVC